MPLVTDKQWLDVGRLPWWRQPQPAAIRDYAKKPAADTATPTAFPRELMTYERKVDFAQIDNDLTTLEAQSRERIHAILTSAKEKVIALISRKVADGSLSTKFVNDLELRGIGQLVPTLREVMGTAFRQGSRDLTGELKRGIAQTARNASDEAKAIIAAHPDWNQSRVVAALKSYQVRYDVAGLPPEKALEFFESKASLWGAEIRDPLLSEIKTVLYNAIKMGLPIREIQAQLEAAFLPWLGDPTQGVGDTLLTPYQLETLIRTNSLEAYNAGRMAQGQQEVESGLITAYVFSAILDGRETAVCRFLDGKFFKPNSSEIDRLQPPRRYNCFIESGTLIFTAHGWKAIRNIERGDLVLTHRGRFMPVTQVHHKENPRLYDGDVVKITVKRPDTVRKGKSIEHFLTVTPEHPVQIGDKWVPASEVKAGDSLRTMASLCIGCGITLPWLTRNATAKALKFCSRSCLGNKIGKIPWGNPNHRQHMSEIVSMQLHKEYANGTRDRHAITKAANVRTREIYAEGGGTLRRPDVRAKMAAARVASEKWRHAVTDGQRGELYYRGRRTREHAHNQGKQLAAYLKAHPEKHGNRVMGRAVLAGHEGYLSKGQRTLYHHATALAIGVVDMEHPVLAGEKRYYLDVAFPEHKIGLEYDGTYWHQDTERDSERDSNLASAGWSILRYRDQAPTVQALREDVDRVLANHAQSYLFTDVVVDRVERWKLRRGPRRLYNIAVAEDESYIAKGFVVHNCRSILVPHLRTEGPVTYITPDQVARGIALSGKGFCDHQGARGTA